MNNHEFAVKAFLSAQDNEVNIFVCSCMKSKEAIIIDAGFYSDAIPQYIEENNLKAKSLFITHGHYDHNTFIDDYQKLYPEMKTISGTAEVKDAVVIGEFRGVIHHIPGHTEDMIVLYINGSIFSGDALFAGSVGGTSNTGNYRRQIAGIRRELWRYPDNTRIHPGHGPDTTLELEKAFNPFINGQFD